MVLSFVLSLLLSYVDHRRHPFGDLLGGNKTDHIAHMHAARLFPRLGFRLYREPLRGVLPRLDDDALRQLPPDEAVGAAYLPQDTFAVQGSRPAYVSWSAMPRPYPPGDMLTFAPVAMAYEWTSLSFATANWMLIVSCLVYAHVGLFLLWQAIHGEWRAPFVVRWGMCFLVAVPVVRFALEGFYDVVLIAPLVLAARWLHDAKWSRAALAFAFAFFLHYRALFFAPYALVALVGAWGSRGALGRRGVIELLLAGVLCGIAGGTLLVVQPWLAAFPLTSPVNIAGGNSLATTGYAAFAFLVMTAFWRTSCRLDAGVALTVFAIIVTVRQVQAWHIIALVPWVVAPVPIQCRSPWLPRVFRGVATAFVYLVLVS